MENKEEKNAKVSSAYSSPIGEIVVETRGNAIIGVVIEDALSPIEKLGKISEPFLGLFRLFDRYFAGERVDFRKVKVTLEGTDFQVKLWQELRRIPYGEVVTYGELAQRIGIANGARAVGGACAKNPLPIIVPCHRVLPSCRVGGGIGGYSAGRGVEVKRFLLELEA
ncbi:MAG: methylated-DNA--[protein]-cysteine S-methyltransferase [Deltaproteobacteria bacterium]|nr:methylated-DNA--[protein]-cysteine S-methyltransferase [Deltaproteobacteria bacterium]